MFNNNKQEALDRAKTLLRVAYELLQKQDDSFYVLNILEQTVVYDEAECDGWCLKDDIMYWFDEFTDESLEE